MTNQFPQPDTLQMGTTFGIGSVVADRYKIVREIGQGGFAKVYEGQHLTLNTPVAIKVLKAREDAQLYEQAKQRFEREAHVLARLHHPNLVKCHDIGSVDSGEHYIVMEYLSGHTLDRELWLHGAMEPQRVHKLMLLALDALTEAHQQGIIHRDLKPSNLFLTQPQRVSETMKIVDFGIAFLYDQNVERLTHTGGFIGTPAYVAPEYVRERIVTPAMDVYQMALIYIEMLTGQPLVDFDDPLNCLYAHCNGHIQLPTHLEHSAIGQVLERALHPNALQRYPNAAEFCEALRQIEPKDIPTRLEDEYNYSIEATWDSKDINDWRDLMGNRLSVAQTFERPPDLSTNKDNQVPARQPSSMELAQTTDHAPPIPTPPKATETKAKGGWLALIALLVLLGLGGAILADQKNSAPSTPADQKVVVPTQPKIHDIKPTPSITKPTPKLETHQITSKPTNAYVYDGKLLLGKTPLEYPKVKAGQKAVTLLIKYDQYTASKLTLAPGSPTQQHIELVKIEAKKTGKKRTKPTSTKPTPKDESTPNIAAEDWK